MRTLSRKPLLRRLLSGATAVAVLTPLATLGPAAAEPDARRTAAARTTVEPTSRQITYRQWSTPQELRGGTLHGTRVAHGRLLMARPVARISYRDPHGYRTKRYDVARWVSTWQRPGYSFEELVASWDALTPADSWIQVQVRGRSESGRLSKWYTMGNWAHHDRQFHRTSLGPQADDLAQVAVDTLKTRYTVGFRAWQMRVNLMRRTGTKATPRVFSVGAMTSLLPSVTRVGTSRPGVARGVRIGLPRYSQMIHQGHYPQYDAGGEAWCSPTSVSMVLGGLGRLPAPREYSWVPARHPDRWVDHAARSHYDYAYEGAGNWSFSAAYAATHADTAFVTRLRNLREAERFIKAGIPLVASVKFGKGELTGAPISSTAGHLMVIVGFTAAGDVIVNDPAAWRNGGVVRTYDRGQFENAWIPKSGGLVYVIRNHDQALPPTRTKNW